MRQSRILKEDEMQINVININYLKFDITLKAKYSSYHEIIRKVTYWVANLNKLKKTKEKNIIEAMERAPKERLSQKW